MHSNYAVLDTSVLISAFLTAGPARQLLHHAAAGDFVPCVSDRLLEEVRRSLSKPKLRAAYRYEEAAVEVFCSRLRTVGRCVGELPDIPSTCRDPNDDHVLAAALASKATVIVTGDDDLLALAEYRGIRIVRLRQFLDLLA